MRKQKGVALEYILFCDESSQKGPKYSDFFGGCLVSAKDLLEVKNALEAKKAELFMRGEVKWSKVTENYLDKYIELMTLFFSFIKDGKVKVRIMFRNNTDEPSDLRIVSVADDKYFKLYYQFIKNAFGFRYLTWGSAPQPIGLVRLTGEMNPPLRTAPSRRFAAHYAFAQCLVRFQQLVFFRVMRV